MNNHLSNAFPKLGAALGTMPLADLPTPVSTRRINLDGERHSLLIKHDDLTATAYGGNKIRKLEYVFHHACFY